MPLGIEGLGLYCCSSGYLAELIFVDGYKSRHFPYTLNHYKTAGATDIGHVPQCILKGRVAHGVAVSTCMSEKQRNKKCGPLIIGECMTPSNGARVRTVFSVCHGP